MFFNLNETNWNSVNLNNDYSIDNIIEKHDDHNYTIILRNGKNTQRKQTHVKLAPLIDPIKYMVGKYETISSENTYGNSLNMDIILIHY